MEGHRIKQIVKMSGYSKSKIERIKDYWLSKEPPKIFGAKYKEIKYILFDGTYFNKTRSLLVFIDSQSGKPFACDYVKSESYKSVYPLIEELKGLGVKPKAITTDGNRSVIKAFLEVWDKVVIQRCLVHIQRQGLSWLRESPKTQAAKELKEIVKFCGAMKTKEDKKYFLTKYANWHKRHYKFVHTMPRFSIAFKDLKRTMNLIDSASKDMFHFANDKKIAPTNNLLEGFFSWLKRKYVLHNGLSSKHQVSYLKWYCYFKNTQN
jgi:hypothetical protein